MRARGQAVRAPGPRAAEAVRRPANPFPGQTRRKGTFMKSSSRPDGLMLTDSPGCFWIFGGFFCVIGGAGIVATIASAGGGFPVWQVLLGIGLGLAAIATGLFLIYDAPVSRVFVSAGRKTLTIRYRGLFRRRQEHIDFSSIESVYLLQGKDIDGDAVFTLRLQRVDGREVHLTHLWFHNRDDLEHTLTLLSQYLPRGEKRRS